MGAATSTPGRPAERDADRGTAARLAVPTPAELAGVDAWWRACCYLTAGQLHLRADPLLRRSPAPERFRRRAAGRWGHSAALALLWAHASRLVRITGEDVRPVLDGHCAVAAAAAWLEGTG